MTPERAAAITAGEPFYHGIPCRRAQHDGLRYAKWGSCVECVRIKALEHQRLNPESSREKVLRWVSENPERRTEIRRRSSEKHREKRNAKQSAIKRANPHVGAADRAHRRAAEVQRTPVWANREAIKAIYKERAEISARTGVAHEVDHFYPLLGRTVSGLHVPENLRIIPAEQNRRKSNLAP